MNLIEYKIEKDNIINSNISVIDKYNKQKQLIYKKLCEKEDTEFSIIVEENLKKSLEEIIDIFNKL